MKKRIVVYDDEERLGRRYASVLQKLKVVSDLFEVESISNSSFENEITLLEKRRSESRDKKAFAGDSLLDEVSILAIDYDLLKSFNQKSFLTGEAVAYMARCFSSCGLIVGINQYGQNTFDLTLKGHPESYCDLNIGSAQIGNIGLWSDTRKGFRPWYWPELPKYLESFVERVRDAGKNLDSPISEVLGFEDLLETFPRSVGQFIGTDPLGATIRDFVMSSGMGLRPKDVVQDDGSMARIAAARISKWLERLVLPGQDILVDAPHLVSRYSSLLTKDHSKIASWNDTARFDKFDKLPLDHNVIRDYRLKKDFWISKPVWLWGKLVNSQGIAEVREPWKRESTKFLFCEDSSSFEKRGNCREFTADVDSPYTQRFIHAKMFEGVDYRPRVRLI